MVEALHKHAGRRLFSAAISVFHGCLAASYSAEMQLQVIQQFHRAPGMRSRELSKAQL